MVSQIHKRGGTILGSSRGNNPSEHMDKIMDTLISKGINQVFFFSLLGIHTKRDCTRVKGHSSGLFIYLGSQMSTLAFTRKRLQVYAGEVLWLLVTLYVHVRIYMYTCACVWVYICIYVYIYIHTCICIYIYIYIYIYICIYIHIYMYTYIYLCI